MSVIAIIGTRDASLEKQKDLTEQIKKYLLENNIEVSMTYSGNALGVDQVARNFNNNIMWLPWSRYNEDQNPANYKIYYSVQAAVDNFKKNNVSSFAVTAGSDLRYDDFTQAQFPWFVTLSDGNRKLIRRNMFIILGDNSPTFPQAEIVFWYTGKGITGGTAYGVNLAKYVGIKLVELK